MMPIRSSVLQQGGDPLQQTVHEEAIPGAEDLYQEQLLAQRAQYGLIIACTVRHMGIPSSIQDIFLNQAMLGSLGCKPKAANLSYLRLSEFNYNQEM